jgi:hypothetical protein
MATSTAGVTVRTAIPGTAVPSLAVIVTAPMAFPVATPSEETVAVAGVEDDQVTLSVRSFVVKFE